jgi:hypothetical protein
MRSEVEVPVWSLWLIKAKMKAGVGRKTRAAKRTLELATGRCPRAVHTLTFFLRKCGGLSPDTLVPSNLSLREILPLSYEWRIKE